MGLFLKICFEMQKMSIYDTFVKLMYLFLEMVPKKPNDRFSWNFVTRVGVNYILFKNKEFCYRYLSKKKWKSVSLRQKPKHKNIYKSYSLLRLIYRPNSRHFFSRFWRPKIIVIFGVHCTLMHNEMFVVFISNYFNLQIKSSNEYSFKTLFCMNILDRYM